MNTYGFLSINYYTSKQESDPGGPVLRIRIGNHARTVPLSTLELAGLLSQAAATMERHLRAIGEA